MDDDVRSSEWRQAVVKYAEEAVANAKGEQKRKMRFHVINEMKDDPRWDSDTPFTWDTFFEYMKKRSSFATFFLLGMRSRLFQGITSCDSVCECVCLHSSLQNL